MPDQGGLPKRRLSLLLLLSVACAASCSKPPSRDEPDPTAGIVLKPGSYAARWIVPRARENDGTNMSAGEAQLSATKPSNLKASPEFKSSHPVFGVIEFNWSSEGAPPQMLMAVDESLGTGKGYDTLYLDADRDLDLSNDRPRKGTRVRDTPDPDIFEVNFVDAASMDYGRLIGRSLSEARPVALDVYLRDYGVPGTPDVSAKVRIRGCWIGEVDSNKGAIPFIVQDWNMNGKFGDSWSFSGPGRSAGDMITFSWGRNGRFSDKFSYWNTYCCAASVASVNGRLFTLRPSNDGAKLDISEFTGPTGKLALKLSKVGTASLEPLSPAQHVTGESGTYDMATSAGSIELPTGRYCVRRVTLCASDSKSGGWMLDYEPFEPYTVASRKTTSVTVGGKISLQIAPKEKTVVLQRGKTCNVRVPTMLPGGQAIVHGPLDYALPVVKLIDKTGKVVYKGNVNRGDYWLRDLKEVPKSLKPGTYTMTATVDVGPFGGKLSASREVIVR